MTKQRAINFKKAPILMGVVNVTPDSFSDGGDFLNVDKAVVHAQKLEQEGAHILDIGGESTRPGAAPVTLEEEQARILPVIDGLKKSGTKALISVDTRHAETMQKSIDYGADIINDVSALTHDFKSLDIVSQAQVPVILMHMKGSPETMQDRPDYDDVVQEIFDYLKARIEVCVSAGIDPNKIICDPGIGFGKTLENNLNILKNLNKFQELGCPILLGASRKSFIEKASSGAPADGRLAGSIAAALQGLEQGVQLFRVHDVAETKQAFDVWRGIHSTHLYANGKQRDMLQTSGGVSSTGETGVIEMQGREVFKYAVKYMADVVEEVLVHNNMTADQIDWLVPHQANIRIIESTAKKLGISMDKVVVTVDRHGNTSAASIPLALDEAIRAGKIKRGQMLLIEAMGGGLTWGAALVRY